MAPTITRSPACIADDAGAERLDTPDRLVADDQACPHRVLAAQDVHVGAADRGQRHADERFADAGLRPRQPRAARSDPCFSNTAARMSLDMGSAPLEAAE